MNYPFYTMTAAEYEVVNKIIRGCRLDCWAIIRQGPHQVDYLYDSEERKTMPLRSGITTLMEAVGCITADCKSQLLQESGVIRRMLVKSINTVKEGKE